LAGFPRNRWSIWIGIGGQFQPEWVVDLDRNGWQVSAGIVTSFCQDEAPLLEASHG
jgi:hypothetical protein